MKKDNDTYVFTKAELRTFVHDAMQCARDWHHDADKFLESKGISEKKPQPPAITYKNRCVLVAVLDRSMSAESDTTPSWENAPLVAAQAPAVSIF